MGVGQFQSAWVLVVFALCLQHASAARNQFQSFEREFESIFLSFVNNDCKDKYDLFVSRNESQVPWNETMLGLNAKNKFSMPLVECLLDKASESIKSNMASAQVILGLTPTILSLLGPSTEETSTLFVIGRRPLLALCIALGTPAINPARAFDYQNPLESLLNERAGRLKLPRRWLSGTLLRDVIITVIEYSIVLSAVANVVQLGVELQQRVILAWTPETDYLPLLWGLLGMFIHVAAAISLALRARVSGGRKSCNKLLNRIKIHFTPLVKLRPLYVTLDRESLGYIALQWIASISTVCHIIFGTLVFSSMMFISTRDAVYVIGRLMGSVICCRIILMYELAALRDSFNVGDAVAGGSGTDEYESTYDLEAKPVLRPHGPIRVDTRESQNSNSSSNIVIVR